MKFDSLKGLAEISQYEKAFRTATGLALRLVPVCDSDGEDNVRCVQNPFCHLLFRAPQGHELCRKMILSIREHTANTKMPHQVHCFAGMAVVGVPVIVGGVHTATLISGQVFLKKPRVTDFNRIRKELCKWGFQGSERAVRRNFLATPVVSRDRFAAMIKLLEIFASQISERANLALIGERTEDPPAVLRAKRFIEANLHETIDMPRVAQHVGFSPSYFCRVFKSVTTVTFSEYLARTRVEHAKKLLTNPFVRVTEVAFQSGFGSIPQFNSVFRRYVGQSPTMYRKSLKQQFRI